MSRRPRPRTLATRLVRAALAASFVLSVSLGAAPAVAAADGDGVTEGIDISHWQGDIDWARVRAAGKIFAFMKASEGVSFVDPTYGLNRARATSAGLIVGAYHYAKPGSTPGDAVAEADHFLGTSGIAVGDLLPVLDLEEHGGLSVAQLQAWTRTYLERIRERTGVSGVIYASPAFWSRYMGGTDWFATNGYRVLWLAHWTTGTPSIPASGWAGFGWTFWQYTSDGSVDGIVGRVDLDRFDGADLASSRIDAVEAGPEPTAADTPFRDIGATSFAGRIAWLYAEGITSGCSPTAYCPGRRVTRGEMATFLAKVLALPKSTKDHFTDDEDTSHEANIDRLAAAGLTGGCAPRRYCPDRAVSRGEVATFIARILELSSTTTDHFRDDDGSTHESGIDRIATAGLTNGCAATRYCPDDALTRGQMAAFLHRTFGY